MYKEFYRGNELLHFPLAAMLFFVAVFTIVTFIALTRHRKDGHIGLLASLPLADDDRPASRIAATAVASGDDHV